MSFEKNRARWSLFSPAAAKELAEAQKNSVIPFKTQNGSLNAKITVDGAPYDLHALEDPLDEIKQQLAQVKLENLQLIYFYGIGLGYVFEALKTWLADKDHFLVLFESDLAQISFLFSEAVATEILQHPRVWLYYLDTNMEVIEPATKFFIGLPYTCFISPLYQKLYPQRAHELKIKIDFYTHALQGFLGEYTSCGASFFYNYLHNLFQWPASYMAGALQHQFKGMPAIICGAGPSLAKQGALLCKLQDRALIFAGGTAMNGVNAFGLRPHAGIGIDPNMAQLSRIIMNSAYEVPFFYRNRIYAPALAQVHAPLVHVPGSYGYKISEYFEEKLGLLAMDVNEGYNVINFSLSIAKALGCAPIILVGVDLAYTDDASYSEGVINHPVHHRKEFFHTKTSAEELVIRNDIYGKPVKTLWKWIDESVWFAQLAARYPELNLINATEGGIGFYGVPNMPLRAVADKYLTKQFAVDLMLFGEMQNAKMPASVNAENINKLLKELVESLQRVLKIVEDIQSQVKLVSSEQIEALASELEKEKGYIYVLDDFKNAYLNLAKRELWRLKVDADLIDTEELKARQEALKLGERNMLKQVALTCLFHIEDIRNELQLKSAENQPTKSPHLFESFEQSIYCFDQQRYQIIDKSCDIDYLETFEEQALLTNEQTLYADGKLKINSYRKKQALHGPFSFYSSQGTLLGTDWFIEGLRQGQARRYYSSQALYAALSYKNGLANGRQRYFYEDGSLRSEISFKDGVLNGKVLLFHASGQLLRKLHFVDGRREGIEQVWNEAGQLLIEAFFKQDRPVGTARMWHANGVLAYENNYEASLPVSLWDDKGQPILEEASSDYFKGVALGTENLTLEIVSVFEQLSLALPMLVPADKKEQLQSSLLALKQDIAKLQELDKQLRFEAGLDGGDVVEPIWKSPSMQQDLEIQVASLTENVKQELLQMQALLLGSFDNQNLE